MAGTLALAPPAALGERRLSNGGSNGTSSVVVGHLPDGRSAECNCASAAHPPTHPHARHDGRKKEQTDDVCVCVGVGAPCTAVDGRPVMLCHAIVLFSPHGRPLSRWLLLTETHLYCFMPPLPSGSHGTAAGAAVAPKAVLALAAVTHVSTSRYWDRALCVHAAGGPDWLCVNDRGSELLATLQRVCPSLSPIRRVARYVQQLFGVHACVR
jgi:hypothetical protein